MSHWAPKPLMEEDKNGLFPLEETVTIVKKGLNPMQNQRRMDGSPYTRHGASALRPEDPKLYIDEDKVSKAHESPAKEAKQPPCDPDEVMKAYLNHDAK